MSVVTTLRRRFDWQAFSKAITTFAVTHGLEEAFPVVDDGRVVAWQDHHEELLEDRDDLEDVPDSPLERLEAGFDLFAQFTMPVCCDQMVCVDGEIIEVPDLDDDMDGDEEPATPLTDEERRLIETTVCDENHAHGLLVSLEGTRLVFQTVLFSDTDGDCVVEAVVETGLVEVPMLRFIESFVKRRAGKSSAR
jgi:hypothetical protein